MPRFHFPPGSLSLVHGSSIWACYSLNDMGKFSLGSTSLFPGHCLITLLRTGTRERRVHDLLSPLAAWARWRGGWGWPLGSLSLHHCLWAFTHSNSVPSSRPGHFLGSGVPPASLKSWLQVHTPFWWESPPSSTYRCLSDSKVECLPITTILLLPVLWVRDLWRAQWLGSLTGDEGPKMASLSLLAGPLGSPPCGLSLSLRVVFCPPWLLSPARWPGCLHIAVGFWGNRSKSCQVSKGLGLELTGVTVTTSYWAKQVTSHKTSQIQGTRSWVGGAVGVQRDGRNCWQPSRRTTTTLLCSAHIPC